MKLFQSYLRIVRWKRKYLCLFFFCGFILSGILAAQEGQVYVIPKAQDKIKTDGLLDDAAWKDAVKIPLPYEFLPGDNIPAPVKTECLVICSRSTLYVGFRCFDPEPRKIRAHLMDRDSVDTFIQDDYVGIYVDTFNDKRRAFQFKVNALGVQVDALFSEMLDSENVSWDAIWNSAAKITDWGYSVEISIPFNQFRFAETAKAQTWGFSAERSYPRNARLQMSSHIRDRNNSCLLCQFNKLVGFENISSGHAIELAPSLTAQRTDNIIDFDSENMEKGDVEIEPGITAKWGITSNVILNAMVNPDFSHVEADVAQLEVNNRFALYYPEKRPFFLEGADFFSTRLKAIFTRTVADPLWGGKLTGKTGKNTYGLIVTQDRICNLLFPANQSSSQTSLDTDVLGGVLRYRRDIGNSSTIGLLYTGRTADDYFNHVVGVDGFLRLNKSNNIRFQYLYSSTDYPDEVSANYNQDSDVFGGYTYALEYLHYSRNWTFVGVYNRSSPGFRADYGFISRVGLSLFSGYLQRQIYGKKGGWFDRIYLALQASDMSDPREDQLLDRSFTGSVTYIGPLQSELFIGGTVKKESYLGVTQDLKYGEIDFSIKPVSGNRLGFAAVIGDAFDYVNLRKASIIWLQPSLEIGLGRHLNLNLSHDFEKLYLGGDDIYKVNLTQARLVYNFNVKAFIRAIIQYRDLKQNPLLYNIQVDERSKSFFTQFLFSYKINPRTVLFLGYSDNYSNFRGLDLIQTDRTFFLKMSYALGL